MKKSFVIYFTFLLLNTQLAQAAEPAFEAYYKFILGGQHSGYVVQRFEIDDKKKEMTSMYYVFVKTPSSQTTESLVAKADLSFEPLSYQYSAIVNGKAKFADATFKNKKMTGKMLDGTKKQNVTLTVPPQGFLSTFLNFILLKNGLMVNKGYNYVALAEETPACMVGDASCNPKDTGFITGSARIKSETVYKNIPAYLVDFEYKGIKFEGYLSHKGETLGSVSPLQDAATEIVATREEAVGPFLFNEKHVRLVFNEVPRGIKNPLHEPKPTPSLPPMPTGSNKKSGD
jgi:hypothetical protein